MVWPFCPLNAVMPRLNTTYRMMGANRVDSPRALRSLYESGLRPEQCGQYIPSPVMKVAGGGRYSAGPFGSSMGVLNIVIMHVLRSSVEGCGGIGKYIMGESLWRDTLVRTSFFASLSGQMGITRFPKFLFNNRFIYSIIQTSYLYAVRSCHSTPERLSRLRARRQKKILLSFIIRSCLSRVC